MKRFGSIKPLERIVHTSALSNFHVVVDSFDKLSTFPNQTVAVFSHDDGEFRKGDVVVNQNGTWTRLVLLKHGLDPVTRLRAMRFGKRVILRWNDPRDRYDHDGNLLSEFYRTILVRKFGSEPENEFDGTQIYINYLRNQYNGQGDKPYFVDRIPEGDGIGKVFYKAFSVSKDGLVNRSTEPVEAKELTWAEISSMIKQGQGERIFSVGDEIPLPSGNALVCAAFDAITTQNPTTNPHSVTFAIKYPWLPIPFDTAKGTYRLTVDRVVLSGKTYYYKDTSDNFQPASLKAGASIPSGIYYESQIPSRGDSGSNRWSTSDIRAWLNSTSEANYGAIVQQMQQQVDNLPAPPLEFLTSELGEEFINIIVSSRVTTGLAKVDGSVAETVGDRIFLPSYTEMTGKKNGTHTEGKQFEGYKDGLIPTDFNIPEDSPQDVVDLYMAGTSTWTRSAFQALSSASDTGSDVKTVAKGGDYVDAPACTTAAVRWFLSIG